MTTTQDGDVETGLPESALENEPTVDNSDYLKVVNGLDGYEGSNTGEKFESFLRQHDVCMVGKTWCPFSRDAKDFLTHQVGVQIYVIDIDTLGSTGAEIQKYCIEQYQHKTVPVIFIRGKLVGGCDDVKSLYRTGKLERELLAGLIQRQQTAGTDKLETSRFVRSSVKDVAMNPLFWFPNTVNNNVVRLTGLQVFILSAISAGTSHEYLWGRYIAVALLIDFGLRMVCGSFASPLGMIATVIAAPFKPDFRPGPPKQFASFCGVFFSLSSTIFYFVDFPNHDYVGIAFMAGLAGAAGMEAFLDFCLGCVFFGIGIQLGVFPDYVYRIHTATKQETSDSWDYKYLNSGAPKPVPVDTNPKSVIALKYKTKTDEWTKDDFDVVRHMQVNYFAMPLSIAGLAVAFKVASSWSTPYQPPMVNLDGFMQRSIIPDDRWYQIIAAIGAAVFVIFALLYMVRMMLYPNKIKTEWDCPLRSPGFGMITITLMLYGFLIYDEIKTNTDPRNEEAPQVIGRVLFWIGAVGHSILTVVKMGEWIGRRLELEHVHPQWMIVPVGLAVAALVAPAVGSFAPDNSNAHGNTLIARFFFSFAWLMWLTLFVVTFFKVVTTHNSDNRHRHGVFIWLAAPCVLGLANFTICVSSATAGAQCADDFANYYFMAIFFFLSLFWASMPHLAFFGREQFGMGYWIECFALDTLAACAALFYTINGFNISQTLQNIALVLASIANCVCFLHTITCIIRQRDIFTPEVKWGPLSFMKLTHEAFRSNLTVLRHYSSIVDVTNDTAAGKEALDLFAANMNRFCILHEEHAKHEDQVIFKTFNDFFPAHAKKWNDDHTEDHIKLENWRLVANRVLDVSIPIAERNEQLQELKADLTSFFDHFEEHLRGEEDHLQPIGRKHLPLAIQKEISREVWRITPAERWEVIVPFIVENLPRHEQRLRYIKVLCWAMPERAQQIGAMIYRNVDAVMWERLRAELPEIIPRAAPGWKRYY